MLTATSRHERGFLSFDGMLSIVPLVMLLSLALQASALQAGAAADLFSRQQLFDRLVSVADYTVKSGAVVREGGMRRPNWLDSSKLTESYAASLGEEAGVSPLYIGQEKPEGAYRICIYRLVVYGADMRPGRLFVCGG